MNQILIIFGEKLKKELMKSVKSAIVAILLLLAVTSNAAKTPKYVFMFIGDGMGVNQVLGTQMYLAELEGRIGVTPLCFTQFPYTGLVTTYSASSGVTDSAASGTALSTGSKTDNNVMGMLPDKETPVQSIAAKAHSQGRRVAICTTVPVDHATPAAFYAHTPSRNDRHVIGMQLAESGYEFFAGGDFAQNYDSEDASADEGNYARCENNGYTIARGYEDYRSKAASADKMILFPGKPTKDLVPRLDRKSGDLYLTEITTAAIDFMMKEPKKGFFIMVEGGQIDYSLHSNDAASCFGEVMDMDDAIKVAYDFYLKHKSETLIIVTADHETGGMSLGNGAYRLALKNLQYQKRTEQGFTDYLGKLQGSDGGPITWEELKDELKDNFGFWDKVQLTRQQESRLQTAYVETFGMNPSYGSDDSDTGKDTEYDVSKISDLAVKILDETSQIAWGTGAHSGGYVPVFAVGNGAELFTGQIDNTQIPVLLSKAAGYRW